MKTTMKENKNEYTNDEILYENNDMAEHWYDYHIKNDALRGNSRGSSTSRK
jgi:negative regulator of sigma E activity